MYIFLCELTSRRLHLFECSYIGRAEIQVWHRTVWLVRCTAALFLPAQFQFCCISWLWRLNNLFLWNTTVAIFVKEYTLLYYGIQSREYLEDLLKGFYFLAPLIRAANLSRRIGVIQHPATFDFESTRSIYRLHGYAQSLYRVRVTILKRVRIYRIEMPYLPTPNAFLEQSSLLLEAYPDNVR